MGAELRQEGLLVGHTDADAQADVERRAAVRVADQFGRENPHELDELMPKLAGRELAKDPAIAAGVLELLDQLGLKPQHIRRRT
jgi:hypothetical protein